MRSNRRLWLLTIDAHNLGETASRAPRTGPNTSSLSALSPFCNLIIVFSRFTRVLWRAVHTFTFLLKDFCSPGISHYTIFSCALLGSEYNFVVVNVSLMRHGHFKMRAFQNCATFATRFVVHEMHISSKIPSICRCWLKSASTVLLRMIIYLIITVRILPHAKFEPSLLYTLENIFRLVYLSTKTSKQSFIQNFLAASIFSDM